MAKKQETESLSLMQNDFTEHKYIDVAIVHSDTSSNILDVIHKWYLSGSNKAVIDTRKKCWIARVGKSKSGSPTIYSVYSGSPASLSMVYGVDVIAYNSIFDGSDTAITDSPFRYLSHDKLTVVTKRVFRMAVGKHQVPVLRLYGYKRKIKQVDLLEF